MLRYRCTVCGFIYDEEKEHSPFTTLTECPICHQSTEKFVLLEETATSNNMEESKELKLDYPKEFIRNDETCRYMKEIHQMAVSGDSI